MTSDLLSATLGSDVLSARQLRAPTVARQADEVLSHERDRPPRAFLPRRVGRRVDDYLTYDPPTGVVRIAARHEKPGERLCHPQRSRFGPVAVEMSQCGPDATTVLDRPCELPRTHPRLAESIVDRSTVQVQASPLNLGPSCDRRKSPTQGQTPTREDVQ